MDLSPISEHLVSKGTVRDTSLSASVAVSALQCGGGGGGGGGGTDRQLMSTCERRVRGARELTTYQPGAWKEEAQA